MMPTASGLPPLPLHGALFLDLRRQDRRKETERAGNTRRREEKVSGGRVETRESARDLKKTGLVLYNYRIEFILLLSPAHHTRNFSRNE